jgi:hypothetical protein
MTRGRYVARERAGRYLRSGAARRSGSTRARRPRSGQLAIAYAVILLGPAAYLALLAATGSGLSTGWLALALVGLALVRSPDSVLPTLVWLALGALWCMVADTHWLVLPAAAVALLSHLATAYVVGAPPDATVDRALAGLWAGRTVVVLAITVGVWALGTWVSGRQLAGSVALTTSVLFGICGWALSVRGRAP